MKNTIYTKAASAALCLAAAASLASCGIPLKQPVYTAPSTAPTAAENPAAEAPVTTPATTEDTAPASTGNPYEAFIDGFKNAVNEQQGAWYYGPDVDPASVSDDSVGIPATGILGDSFSYILYDMDKDGTDELFIGGEVTDQSEPRINVYGVVTVEDGKYTIIAAGWERSELTYLGGTSFYEAGSSGANLHGASLYTYNSSKKALDLIYSIEYETKEDGKTSIELFEGENGKVKSNVASAKDKEAEEKFEQARKDASKDKSDILGKEWTKVSFK